MSLHCLNPAAITSSQQSSPEWGRRLHYHMGWIRDRLHPLIRVRTGSQDQPGGQEQVMLASISQNKSRSGMHTIPLESRIGLGVRDKQSLGKMLGISRPVS